MALTMEPKSFFLLKMLSSPRVVTSKIKDLLTKKIKALYKTVSKLIHVITRKLLLVRDLSDILANENL
jgi:hypothetical protein